MKTRILIALCAGILPAAANASMLNEFEPNPAGGDPADTTFELIGTPSAAFDLWILSIENDPGGSLGVVDRAANVAGSYDANGLAVVTTPDLENPSFTVILTDAFTGAIGDDLDVGDTGTLDTSSLGAVLDAVGVSDTAGDDGLLYGASLGGTDILFNGEFEPLNVFRDSVTGEWYQSVTVDFGAATERIGIFPASGAAGGEIAPSAFAPDASGTTFGFANPTLIPEPGTIALALLSLASAGAVSMRSRLG